MTRNRKTFRPAERLLQLGRWASGSIGEMEMLSGVNTQSIADRTALWNQFRHLFAGDSKVLIAAVMDHCATIALQRIQRGELSLLPATI